jgi:hypothetical protein
MVELDPTEDNGVAVETAGVEVEDTSEVEGTSEVEAKAEGETEGEDEGVDEGAADEEEEVLLSSPMPVR